jgi:hypothetical protein
VVVRGCGGNDSVVDPNQIHRAQNTIGFALDRTILDPRSNAHDLDDGA